MRKGLERIAGEANVYWIGHRNPIAHWEGATASDMEGYSVIGGHYPASDIASKVTSPSALAAVVREPIERAMSLYQHMTRSDRDHPLRDELRALGLLGALHDSPRFIAEVQNQQCRLISGEEDFGAVTDRLAHEPWLLATVDQSSRVLWAMAREMRRLSFRGLRNHNAGPPGYLKALWTPQIEQRLVTLTQEDARLFEFVRGRPPVLSTLKPRTVFARALAGLRGQAA